MAEVDRLPGQVAAIATRPLGEVQAVWRNARRALARRPRHGRRDRRLDQLLGKLAETIGATKRLLWQTDQRLAGTG